VDAVGGNSLPIIGHPLLHLKSEIDEGIDGSAPTCRGFVLDINYHTLHAYDRFNFKCKYTQ